MTQEQLETLKNSKLASGQPITAAIHRSYAQDVINEMYNPNSRAALLVTADQVAATLLNDDMVFIKRGAAGVFISKDAFALTVGSLRQTLTKNSHGFAVGDVLTLDGSGIAVKVSSPSGDIRFGVVNAVTDANTFTVTLDGYVSGLSGLTAGTKYYSTAAGTLSDTISDMPVLMAVSASAGYMLTSAAAVTPDLTSKLDATNTLINNNGDYTMAAPELAVLVAGGSLVSQGNNTGVYHVPQNLALAIPVNKQWAVRGYSSVVGDGSMVITGTRGDLTIPVGMTSVIEKTGANTCILHNGIAGGGGASYYGQTTGVNTYAVDLTPTLTALATGVVIKVKFKDASSGVSTLNTDSLGAKKLYKNPTTQIGSGDITDEQIYDMTYDASLDGAAGGWLIDGLTGGGSVAFASASEINTGTEAAKATAPDQLAVSTYLTRRGAKRYADSTTAANTYTATFTPAVAAGEVAAGLELHVKFTNPNTGAATFNPDGTGAVAIVNADGSALRAYQITANHLCKLIHNGTAWVLVNPASRRSILGNAVALNNSAGTNYLVLATPGTGTTLDCKNLEEIKFDGPVVGSLINSNFTVTPANDAQLQYGGFIASLTAGNVITFPSSFVMAATEWRWAAGSRQFTVPTTGYYEFVWTRTIDNKFLLKATDQFPTT